MTIYDLFKWSAYLQVRSRMPLVNSLSMSEPQCRKIVRQSCLWHIGDMASDQYTSNVASYVHEIIYSMCSQQEVYGWRFSKVCNDLQH